jgi:bifunctional DNase/RNase
MRSHFPLLILALGALACSGGSAPPRDDVAVVVGMVTIDPMSKTPVVVLEEQRGGRRLPIWIGVNEARAIAQRLEDVTPPRPNTHDLAQRLVEGLDAAVERVTVTELRESTYYAVIALRAGEARIEIDSRPSDAIALALRTAAPVFVREALFEEDDDGDTDDGGEHRI